MTLDDILASLFVKGHAVTRNGPVVTGSGSLRSGAQVLIVGVADRAPLGIDEAIQLSNRILNADARETGPILVTVDSDSQRMRKRDELLGLDEFLSHLAKTLIYADINGRPTVGLLYGHSAAGAFLATALATRVLVALPTGDPAVMDLQSMSKVTKLPIEVLEEKAKSTPVFAPGLRNLFQTGAVHEIWDDPVPLGEHLEALLAHLPDARDRRSEFGKTRGGRLKAHDVAERVRGLAVQAQ